MSKLRGGPANPEFAPRSQQLGRSIIRRRSGGSDNPSVLEVHWIGPEQGSPRLLQGDIRVDELNGTTKDPSVTWESESVSDFRLKVELNSGARASVRSSAKARRRQCPIPPAGQRRLRFATDLRRPIPHWTRSLRDRLQSGSTSLRECTTVRCIPTTRTDTKSVPSNHQTGSAKP